jgi:hypothetical protein
VPGCTVAPPSSPRPAVAFASQLLLPIRRAITTTSVSVRAVVCLHQGRAFRCLILDGLRRSPRMAPLLPCGSARSRRTAAPPIPRATSLHIVALHVVALHNYSSSTPVPCTVTPPRRCRTRGPRPYRAAPARRSAPLPLARGKEAQDVAASSLAPQLHSHA